MDSEPNSTSTYNEPSPVELIFLGTGTSSSVPNVHCLTAPPSEKPCRTCISTLIPEGKKNIRRNTSCALRMEKRDGEKVTVVIDAGKNFQASALEWFPKYGLRRIDALLLTHSHADAINGLDDLRGWTLGKAIQPHIDVYLSQETFAEVKRSFPYLVAKEYASGGGDVPEFKWHFITDEEPFEIPDTGIMVTPFSVHHGRIFSTMSSSASLPTPVTTIPSAPTEPEIIHPYLCFGFKIGYEVVYISDVSYIPKEKWAIIESKRPGSDAPLPVLVLDCLGIRVHPSHMGLKESIETARRVDALRTYFTGFSHRVSHDEYVTIGEAAGGITKDLEGLSETEREGLEVVQKGKDLWVRPGHDGLRVFVERNGQVWDESY